MSAVNTNFIAGHYSNTYGPGGSSGASIGTTRRGFTIKETHHSEPIMTDDGGEAPVDGVQMGTECLVTLEYVEYALALPALYQANGRGRGKDNVGKLETALAGPLVLTPVAGTTAASAGGTYTFPKAIVASDIETLLASRLREGPITFRCYPDSTGALYTVA